jgi:hypothetical protein
MGQFQCSNLSKCNSCAARPRLTETEIERLDGCPWPEFVDAGIAVSPQFVAPSKIPAYVTRK